MKNLFFLIGSSLLKRWIETGVGSFTGAKSIPGMPKLNTEYIGKTLRNYAITAGLAVLSIFFFVSGASMAIFSAAQSFDLFGVFVAGAVFYTGLLLAAVSATAFGICLLYARKKDFRWDQIYVEVEEPVERQPAFLRAAKNLWDGVREGWTAPRTYHVREEPARADINYSQFKVYDQDGNVKAS